MGDQLVTLLYTHMRVLTKTDTLYGVHLLGPVSKLHHEVKQS